MTSLTRMSVTKPRLTSRHEAFNHVNTQEPSRTSGPFPRHLAIAMMAWHGYPPILRRRSVTCQIGSAIGHCAPLPHHMELVLIAGSIQASLAAVSRLCYFPLQTVRRKSGLELVRLGDVSYFLTVSGPSTKTY